MSTSIKAVGIFLNYIVNSTVTVHFIEYSRRKRGESQFANMQFLWFGIMLSFFVEYGTSSKQFHGTKEDLASLPFQDKVEEVFDAYRKGDFKRMDKIFKFLESVDPNELNPLDMDNINFSADYTNERINYVVSVYKKNKLEKL